MVYPRREIKGVLHNGCVRLPVETETISNSYLAYRRRQLLKIRIQFFGLDLKLLPFKNRFLDYSSLSWSIIAHRAQNKYNHLARKVSNYSDQGTQPSYRFTPLAKHIESVPVIFDRSSSVRWCGESINSILCHFEQVKTANELRVADQIIRENRSCKDMRCR